MSIWYCKEHGLTGPNPCCGLSELACIEPEKAEPISPPHGVESTALPHGESLGQIATMTYDEILLAYNTGLPTHVEGLRAVATAARKPLEGEMATLRLELLAYQKDSFNKYTELASLRDKLKAAKQDIAYLKEDNENLKRRRGGECQKCGSWVCPPLTCMACLSDAPDEMRILNQKMTAQIMELELRAKNAEYLLKEKNGT